MGKRVVCGLRRIPRALRTAASAAAHHTAEWLLGMVTLSPVAGEPRWMQGVGCGAGSCPGGTSLVACHVSGGVLMRRQISTLPCVSNCVAMGL